MQREFGVQFEIKTEILSIIDLQKGSIQEGYIKYIPLAEWLNENDIDLVNYDDDVTLYVVKESEGIFKPKDYDLAVFTREDGISTVGQYSKNKDAFINGNFRILKKMNPKIMMRDNKHFFAPEMEVEND